MILTFYNDIKVFINETFCKLSLEGGCSSLYVLLPTCQKIFCGTPTPFCSKGIHAKESNKYTQLNYGSLA